jgi:3',5'-cyclic AMP phosphodiesterase CpdA
MTRIVCIADQHGHVDLTVPECDLLIIAGDVCPTFNHDTSFQKVWLESNYTNWLKEQPAKSIVLIAGNHDFANLHYLQDSGVYTEGLSVWGTPWSLDFGPWAFMDNDKSLAQVYDEIPEGVDIVVSHTPMYGLCDRTADDYNAGSKYLRTRMQKVQPRLFVCGHIHEAYGHRRYGNILIKNASLRDEYYNIKNSPIIVDL